MNVDIYFIFCIIKILLLKFKLLLFQILKEAGASQVVGLATHGIFSGQAIDRIKNSEDLDLVVVTNSIPEVEEKGQKIRYIDASTLIAKAIIESETSTNV